MQYASSIASLLKVTEALGPAEEWQKVAAQFSSSHGVMATIEKANALHQYMWKQMNANPISVLLQDWQFPESHKNIQPLISARVLSKSERTSSKKNKPIDKFPVQMRKALEAINNTDLNEEPDTSEAVETMVEKCSTLKPSIINLRAMLDHAFHFILFLIALYDTHYLVDHLEEVVEKVDKELRAEIEKLNPGVIEGNYALAKRDTFIKSYPGLRCKQKTVLYKGQLLRVIEERHKWVRVEYYNYKHGCPEVGWVKKKCIIQHITVGMPKD